MCGMFVVNVLNPVHSVFFLIVLFLFSALYMFLLRNEFLAIMIIIVYIGAISVLFLFVIMMLNIKLLELKAYYISYVPLSILLLVIFCLQWLIYIKTQNWYVFSYSENLYLDWLNFYLIKGTNIHVFGLYLYSYYYFIFVFSGFLLFLATIGAILLTHVAFNDLYSFDKQKRYQVVSHQYFVDYGTVIKML